MPFEYKVVPAPETGLKRRGLRSPGERFAAALAETLKTMAADGWEYQRADILPVREGGGMFSRAEVVDRAMLVFRRPLGAPAGRVAEPRALFSAAPLAGEADETVVAPAAGMAGGAAAARHGARQAAVGEGRVEPEWAGHETPPPPDRRPLRRDEPVAPMAPRQAQVQPAAPMADMADMAAEARRDPLAEMERNARRGEADWGQPLPVEPAMRAAPAPAPAPAPGPAAGAGTGGEAD
ncbi:MAG: hypothetical protein AAFZ09_09200, partial [Pseudomonadota bacterium]